MESRTRKLLLTVVAVTLILACLAIWIWLVIHVVKKVVRDRRAREVEDNGTEAKLSWSIHTIDNHTGGAGLCGKQGHRMLAVRADRRA